MEEAKPDNVTPKKKSNRASLRFKKAQEWVKDEYEKLMQESNETLNFNDLAIMAMKAALPEVRKRVKALKGEGFLLSAMT